MLLLSRSRRSMAYVVLMNRHDLHDPWSRVHKAQSSEFANKQQRIQLRNYRMQLQMSLPLRAVIPIISINHLSTSNLLYGLTLQTGVLKSQSLTVISSPEEMKESSAGDICIDRTLLVSSIFTSRGPVSRALVPSEVIQIFVIVHRMISNCMITFCRGM